MLILALDTSSSAVSVALLDEEKVLAYREQIMDRGQGEALVPIIADVLDQAKRKTTDITGVAVAIGPGSFTGVRVGLSTARGIGLALNIPVYGVTNFEAVAYGLLKPIKIVLDTKRGDYFTQDFDESGCPISNPKTQTSDDLKSLLPFTAIGDGAEKLSQEIGCNIIQKISPSAVSIAKIAISRSAHPLPPEPLYLRDADVTI
ncbi:MAG: tRNA (adenosine(37)-N6)-threonylcarbamoyltransferase complex dimerization subunit type 1 TsaB [Alphaproteobacteria bacterium]|nr:tRNA (adenosine(37)-N6)-threonylcarbamoyltransferase complex dimerization subunit type 1 TsaB [Alphaproteobacteria bacterium]